MPIWLFVCVDLLLVARFWQPASTSVDRSRETCEHVFVFLQGHVALMSYHMQRSCGHEWEARIDHSRVPAESRSWVTDAAAWGLDLVRCLYTCLRVRVALYSLNEQHNR